MKKYRVLLSVCFMSFCGFSTFAGTGYTNVLNKNETRLKSNFDNRPLFVSDSLPGAAQKRKLKGWEILFDGTNTDKWRSKNSETFPSGGWIVKDGSLVLGKKGAGDIITREKYSNFELDLDFNLTNEANSGVKYFVGELKNSKTGNTAINGPEYQIIDDYNHPEVKNHQHDIAATASCYLLYTPKNVHLRPAGEWNHIRIIAKGKHVEHWLNGVKVLSYERGSADFLKRKSETKFKDDENYGELASGHILLTDHGDKVYFKNIKIKRL
ncbi:MAG: DUF1080 domain-containing protein [Ginsengibacter sp.]